MVFHYVQQLHSSMSLFEVVHAKQSAGVDAVRLDLSRTVVVTRSVDDQDVGETAAICFWCVSQRIEKFGGSHEEKVKRHPVTSAVFSVSKLSFVHWLHVNKNWPMDPTPGPQI